MKGNVSLSSNSPSSIEDWVLQPGARAFAIAVDILTHFECLSIGLAAAAAPGKTLRPGHAVCAIPRIGGSVSFNYQGIISSRIQNLPIEHVVFQFSSENVNKSSGKSVDGARVSSLLATQYGRLFSAYWEEQRNVIDDRFGTDAQHWSSFLNFCRIFRNSSSHSGRVNILKPNSPSGEWRGLKIGYADHGHVLIGPDAIEIGDILLLFKDLTAFLDKSGVTLPIVPVPHEQKSLIAHS